MLTNTGHSVLFRMDMNSSQGYDDSRLAINITGGPLSYRYRFEEMHIHYGLHDQYGSEHSVQGYTFPAEVSCVRGASQFQALMPQVFELNGFRH